MEEVNNVPMVTIPLDEYFNLRTRAEQSIYLANELGRIEARFVDIDNRIYDLQKQLMEAKGYERR